MNSLFFNLRIQICASLVLAFFLCAPKQVTAQKNLPAVQPKKLAVDVVSLRRVGRIHGIILEQLTDSISIVVRRDWLKTTYPEFFEKHIATEKAAQEQNRKNLKQRIAQWRTEHEGDEANLIGSFLDENERMLELDKPIDLSSRKFTVVKLTRDQYGRVYSQTPDRNRLVGIGWSEKIPDVETTNAVVLKRKLEQRGIDIDSYDLKLGNDLPALPESDEKWEARKALVEFALLRRLEYQVTGTAFFRRGENANPVAAIQAMMQSGMGGFGGFSEIEKLGKELGLPEFQNRRKGADDQAWLKPMIESAEKENRRCFSVARLTQGDTVTIDLTLYFKAFDQRWHPLAVFKNSEKLSDQSKEDVELIMQDEQVSRVFKMAKQFGMNNQSILDKAVRSGVATRKALDKSMSQLDEYVESYANEIDNPPIK